MRTREPRTVYVCPYFGEVSYLPDSRTRTEVFGLEEADGESDAAEAVATYA